MRIPCVIAVLSITTCALPLPALAQEHRLAGHWEGEIVLPTGELQVKVDLDHDAEGWSGTIDIPAQGAAGLPLTDFAEGQDSLRFTIAGIPGEPTFDGQLADGELRGTFVQGGARLDFRLGREAVEEPRRPQDPEPPFPYDVEEVTIESAELTLAGTLTLPRGEGRVPAALLLSGSGAQNRDEEIFGHRPFLVLADHLTRAGIAVLRLDDRGVGGSGGDLPSSTSADLADDALSAIAFLRQQSRIDPESVGLIGHSEGGVIAPMAAARSSDVAFVVLLAGSAVPGSEVLPRQLELLARANGTPEELLERQLALQAELIELLAQPISEQRSEAMRRVIHRQIALAPEASRPEGEELERTVESALAGIDNPWFRFFVTHDPRPTLEQVEVPVLALNGELDLQVDADQNLTAIESALERGGNEDFTALRLAGLNHLFQPATTGAVSEYAQIEQTIAPEVLELVAEWILVRFDLPRRNEGNEGSEPE